MIAHDVDQGNVGSPSVVQVGESIAEPRPEMEECGGRPASNASVTVGSAGDHSFKKPQYTAH